jgi:D-3-phosphoglycerate dehydrogenase / 2-oxoglutarate reductase
LIGGAELARMKPDGVLVNTSRGNMIVEANLADALRRREIGGAAIDVFGCEPYQGELCELDNCLLTTHMGSMARDRRGQMELEATQEVIRFFNAEPLQSVVPESEYSLIQCQGISVVSPLTT